MQQDRSRQFAGAVLGSWHAPNITPDANAGIGAMGTDELFRYLKFGKVAGKAQAGGEMGLAVQLSFSKLSDDDLKAIVAYVRSVPPIGDAETKAKFAQGQPFTEVAKFRGIGATSSSEALPGGAAQLFAANCASCHGIGAGGSRDNYFPSLFHNSALATGAGRNLAATILFGIDRSTADGLAFMPGFGGKATDIAAFTNEQVVELGELSFGALWQRGVLHHAADGRASPHRTSSQAIAGDFGRRRQMVSLRLGDLARTLVDCAPLVAHTRLTCWEMDA